eukprot:g1260.t1
MEDEMKRRRAQQRKNAKRAADRAKYEAQAEEEEADRLWRNMMERGIPGEGALGEKEENLITKEEEERLRKEPVYAKLQKAPGNIRKVLSKIDEEQRRVQINIAKAKEREAAARRRSLRSKKMQARVDAERKRKYQNKKEKELKRRKNWREEEQKLRDEEAREVANVIAEMPLPDLNDSIFMKSKDRKSTRSESMPSGSGRRKKKSSSVRGKENGRKEMTQMAASSSPYLMTAAELNPRSQLSKTNRKKKKKQGSRNRFDGENDVDSLLREADKHLMPNALKLDPTRILEMAAGDGARKSLAELGWGVEGENENREEVMKEVSREGEEVKDDIAKKREMEEKDHLSSLGLEPLVIPQSGPPQSELNLLMAQCGVTEADARKALLENNSDIVSAVIALTTGLKL